MISLRPLHAKIIAGILKKHVPKRRILVFGSRATGRSKPHADLDLAVLGKKPVLFSVLYDLREDFMESDLPFRVDVLDWARTSEEFRKIIKRDGIELK